MSSKVIKETKYCAILKQGKVNIEESIYSIERIFVKPCEREEIRFGFYKQTRYNNEKLIPRALDVTEEELLQLFKEAKSKRVFSKKFIDEIKEILK